jgi:hypothetical protein
MTSPKPLTAAEVVEHPEFKHTIWDLKPSKKGKVSVARGRGGPFNIAYEIHGEGPVHLLVRRLDFFRPFFRPFSLACT